LQAVIPVAFGLAGLRHGLYTLYPSLRPDDTENCNQHPVTGSDQAGDR